MDEHNQELLRMEQGIAREKKRVILAIGILALFLVFELFFQRGNSLISRIMLFSLFLTF